MKLSSIIREVWKDERVRAIKLRKDEVKIVVEVFIDVVRNSLLKYGSVKLIGLFTLKIRGAKGRRIQNPQTKEEMYSKDYYKVGIENSSKLKEGLKNYKK